VIYLTRSVGIVRSRTQTMEFSLVLDLLNIATTAAEAGFLIPLYHYLLVCHRNRLCLVVVTITPIYKDETRCCLLKHDSYDSYFCLLFSLRVLSRKQ
jgi:hypothetical protein